MRLLGFLLLALFVAGVFALGFLTGRLFERTIEDRADIDDA